MKPINVQTSHHGSLKLQQVTFEYDDGTQEDIHRLVSKPQVVALCHDAINDKVALLTPYQTGSLSFLTGFPEGTQEQGEKPVDAVYRIVEEQLGTPAKSATLLYECLSRPDISHAPVSFYYVTYDSREVDEDLVELKSAKEIIREVEDNKHSAVSMVIGAQYLKLLHRGLVK